MAGSARDVCQPAEATLRELGFAASVKAGEVSEQ
jgi:hypothetical protein